MFYLKIYILTLVHYECQMSFDLKKKKQKHLLSVCKRALSTSPSQKHAWDVTVNSIEVLKSLEI